MKILIVDDIEVNLALLEARLEEGGYEVTSAMNGVEALEILKTDSIDMIISDILMPKMDGYQLCRECKNDDTLRKIPFIFYTATYTDKKDEEFALSLGADRFIVKPMEHKHFMEIIEEVLKNHKKGLLTPFETPAEKKEAVYLKQYSERLIKKLEQKMLDLKSEITQRKLAEENLRETNEFLKNILNSSSSISIVSTDLEGNVLFWNKGSENIFGYKAEEIVGRQKIDILYHDDETKKVVKETRPLIFGNKKGISIDIKEATKDGRELWINLSLTPRFDEENNVIGVLGIGKDITERKQAEEKLARHLESLEELVEERTHELTKANQQLNQQIEERQKAGDELKKRTDELQAMVNAMAGREIRMIELKKVIKKLRGQLEEAGMTPVADDPLKEGRGSEE